MNPFSKIKNTFDDIRDDARIQDMSNNCLGVVSLNKGSGAKTVTTAIALEMAKEHRVCILDCNFTQPGMGILLNNPIKTSMSVLNYFNSSSEISECIHQVNGQKNMWIVSTSPVDSPLSMANLQIELMEQLVEYLKKSFDYLVISLNYAPFTEWFMAPLNFLDKGFIVWDEQVDNVIMTEAMIDYVYKTSNAANVINNIIINKKTRYPIIYSTIEQIECNLVAELPFDGNIMTSKNEGKLLVDNSSINKAFTKEIKEIVKGLLNKKR